MLRFKDKYRFTFALNVPKDICPSCKQKTLRLFLDKQTNQILNNNFGVCDRVQSCGFKQYPSPKDPQEYIPQAHVPKQQAKTQEYVFKKDKYGQDIIPSLPTWLLETTQANNYKNDLFLYLCSLYPNHTGIIENVFAMYKIGATKNGSCVFPYIDFFGNFKAAQVRKYDKNGHGQGTDNTLVNIYKRGLDKSQKDVPLWLDDYLSYTANFGTYTCLFGEHLIKDTDTSKTPIWLVEAPKTALVATVFFNIHNPQADIPLILSCRTLNDYKESLINVLKPYNFTVIPDLGQGLKTWAIKTEDFKKEGYKIQGIDLKDVFNVTQEDIRLGLDLADYLLRD